MTQFVEINGELYRAVRDTNWTPTGFSGQSNSQSVPKYCPFCGSQDIHKFQPTAYEIGDEASVKCEECGAEVRGETLKIALRKWNRRVKE